MSNESKYHAVNYSILMGLLNYSQSRLEKLQDKLDQLVFIDHLVDASLLRDILQVSNSEIQATALAAKAAIDNLELDDVNVISIKDELYPQLLKQVRRPPQILFYRGLLELAHTPCVSVVGSRNATELGILRAQKVALVLTQHNYTVVSGLAKGIDTAAQTATIKAGGKTIGVIGTTIDKFYPNENKQLQNQIAAGHLLISQFPLQQPGSKYNFPQRNHTMCGLSTATIIVEAGETSGALYQATSCIQENRKLFLMKSLLENKKLEWPQKFVNQGAIVVKDPENLLEELEREDRQKVETSAQMNIFGKTALG